MFFLQALREACSSHTEMIKIASSGAWYDRHLYVNATSFLRIVCLLKIRVQICAEVHSGTKGRGSAQSVPG